MIENHAIFGSDHQLPGEIQLAIFLNCAGHYGSAAIIQNIADWAGISVGSIYNYTNCVMIAIASLHDSAISWNLHDPDYIREKARAKEWVESRTCGEWRGGYLNHVLASSRSLGIMVNPFMTRSATTLLIARFLSFFFFFPLTFIYFIFMLFVSHIICRLSTMLLAWLEVFMIPQPLQHLISHRSQHPFLLQMSGCG
jgi:hypothetical protein